MHIAGGAMAEVDGLAYIEDTHSPEPLEAAWEILEYVVPRARNLRAIVYECELNAPEECLTNFARINKIFI
jgi:hypothetical protein